MRLRRILGAALASALLLTIAEVPAHADTYAPNAVDQDFVNGPGGWTNTTVFSGACLQPLICPAVANEWAAGGADGNGYIRTRFSSVTETLAGTSTGVWESPAFTYDGNGGKVPAALTLDMNMLDDVSGLLGLSVLNDTSYRVDLVDQTTTNQISVVPSTPIAADATWTATPTASVNPAQLTMGRAYKIRITTSYHAGTTVAALGEVGYDNVRLQATGAVAGGGNPVGPNGGSGITTVKQLRKLAKTYILPSRAKVDGHLLVVHLRCPAIASPKPCQLQFAGLQAGRFSKSATARKVVKLKAGKARTVKLRIKPAYVAEYKAAKKIWTKTIVRVGKVRVTVRKRMKV